MQDSEERQILSLLRELITQSGITPGDLEIDLGWEPERLERFLEGKRSLTLRDLLIVLAMLEVSSADFFGRLYGFEIKEESLMPAEEATQHRFQESRRVINNALSRRSIWKKDRLEL
jgi:hypothetical protein